MAAPRKSKVPTPSYKAQALSVVVIVALALITFTLLKPSPQNSGLNNSIPDVAKAAPAHKAPNKSTKHNGTKVPNYSFVRTGRLPQQPPGFSSITVSCEKKIYALEKWKKCQRYIYLMPPVRGYFDEFSALPSVRTFNYAAHPFFDNQHIESAVIQRTNKRGWETIEDITHLFKDPLKYSPCRSYQDGCGFNQVLSLDTSGFEPDLYTLKISVKKQKQVRNHAVAFPFIVRPPRSQGLVLVYPNWTHQAYSRTGGLSLYKKFHPNDEAFSYDWVNDRNKKTVSFKRPIEGVRLEHRYHVAVPLLNFLKARGLEYTIIAQEDFDTFIQDKNTSTLVLFGHNEYWTRKNTLNLQSFLKNSGRVLNLSGNTLWWWLVENENSISLDRGAARNVPISNYARGDFMPPDLQTAALLGSSFVAGGYPVSPKDKNLSALKSPQVNAALASQELITKCAPSWVKRADLKTGYRFGAGAKSLRVELDGIALVQDSFEIDPNFKIDQQSRLRVIAYGPARVNTPFFNEMGVTSIPLKIPFYSGLVSEYDYRGKGRVLNFNSVGVTSVLTDDSDDAKSIQKLIAAMIVYLENGTFENNDIPNCLWFEGSEYKK